MEDDIAFGASVWGAPASPLPPLSVKPPVFAISPAQSSTQEDFDDFDNFRTPAETAAGSGDEGEDDDFGDFGDFGETQQLPVTASFQTSFGELAYDEPQSIGGSSVGREWQALRLDPLPSREELQEQVDEILGPLWIHDDTSHLTDDAIREVGGLNQTLVTNESRQLYNALLPPTPPSFQPVNWTRSRIRRQHLIHLGIPINLDEVLPRTNGALPTLEITTRPMSAPPGPRGGLSKLQTAALGQSRSGTSHPNSPSASRGASAAAQLRLGPRPEIEEAKIDELIGLSAEQMSLMSISTLEKNLADIRENTVKASTLLTYLLQTRDALQQDSETYNKLIGELVGEAQKIKTGKRMTGSATRRGSGA
ncbi:hypothetical protein BD309DRAFT_953735 [Dichomitus squalens]|uniref:Uncharacterized protein n=2 Tax=Dichomitus squalens TaxID=114155 RepID=A0A4Q9MZG2_9APHY|nr:uncharacterized protein DICSQDRAFT_93474 [Dichomitus squalens LYAD-421 SS1]EJF56608.1 hypothetical protein DICSQDRAFT_93474 [Dichomitus squalens LYAD-421 SS1]TBU33195.1 hypothetical protein BD311DRAFT_749402 [Dichomitus squalens]TBU46603.1 hypothetical protein BD309DRAFT_953735 [Dichomitus squalens]TBU58398.1 hypothetical protein BD310DRAFT_927238 [Dichomitus squalens]